MSLYRRVLWTSLLAVALILFSGMARAQNPALAFNGNPAQWEYTQGSYIIGWYFKPAAAVSVTALGWYNDSNGLIDDHPVGIYEIAAGRFVAAATVYKNDPLTGAFRYHDLLNPVVLQAGVQYALVGVSFRDHYLSFTPGINSLILDPRITHLGATANNDWDFNTTQLGPPKKYLSGGAYWTVTNMKLAAPTTFIASLTPSVVKAGSIGFPLTIDGIGFDVTSTAYFNNSLMTILSASPTSITINVPANLLTAPTTYNVTVRTGANLSNAVPFRVSSAQSNNKPPSLKIVGHARTGVDQFSATKYCVLLLGNRGGSDMTNIAFSDVRFYYDKKRPTVYVNPINMILEVGGTPPGDLSRTAPGEYLQIRWEWPITDIGPVQAGTISIRGTSDQGAFNAGTRYLVFP